MRTEIKIYATGIYYNLDLSEDEPLPLVKSIANIKNPEERQSDFTKTIRVPGTANNNQIFSNIFDVNHGVINTSSTQFNADFNPNLKANCILFKDGVPQIRGYLQLTDIILSDQYGVQYEIIIIGRNANLFQDLGDSMLNELDLSAYNHAWTYANIVTSWSAAVGVGYVYPLIDRGDDPFEKNYYVDQTFPAVYLKTILDAIFLSVGYRYSSAFFLTTRFKSLIMPFSGDTFRKTEADVDDRIFELDRSSDSAYIVPDPAGLVVPFNRTVKDSDPIGISGSTWTVPAGNAGDYTFRTELDITIQYIGGAPATINNIYFSAVIVKNVGGTITGIGAAGLPAITIPWAGSINPNDTISFLWSIESPKEALPAGATIYVTWGLALPFGVTPTITDFQVKFKTGASPSGSRFFNTNDGSYQEGNTIDIASALPPDLKQADFLKGLIKMFNLYFEPDPIDDKKLIIEPKEDYYLSTVVDLTQTLDVSRDIVLKPMGALDFKTLEFHYKKDTDDYNSEYLKRYVNEYGFRRVTINNDFIVEKKLVELPFAPTPLVSFPNNNRVISKIRYLDANGIKIDPPKGSMPRILFYGGLINTGAGTYYLGTRGSALTMQTQYAYAGHLDSVASPTFDLNFAIPSLLFYGAGKNPTLTDANLYNIYWSKAIAEITDKDSKIMICYLHLTNVQLQNISFRNSFLIDRQYYRLHNIEADLNSDEPAKCEFLKLKTAPAFVATTGPGNGGIGVIGDEPIGQFIESNTGYQQAVADNLKWTVQTTSGVVYADNQSGMYLATGDVYLPLAQNSFDSVTGKSIEILIENTNGTFVKVYYGNGTPYFTLIKSGRFVTDGVTWYADLDSTIRTITTAVNVSLGAYNHIITATASGVTLTAPTAAAMNPDGTKSIVITVINACNAGGDTITITGTISGVVNPVLAQYDSLTFFSDGTNLLIM